MKQTIAMLLSLAMLLGMLAACGDSGESKAETAAAVSEKTSQEVAATPVETVPQPASSVEEAASAEASSAEPEKIAYELPLTTGGETLTMFAISNSNVTDNIGDLNHHQIYQKAEEVTGVKVDIKTYMQETSAEQFSLVLASGDYPDMVRSGVYPSGIASAYDEDIIINFADYLDCAPNYAAILDENPDIAKDAKTDDGRILEMYFLNAYQGKFEVPLLDGPVIQQNLLDAQKLSIPTTVDELHDVLTALKSVYQLSDPLYLGNNVFSSSFLMGAYETTPALYQVDGTVKYGPMEDGFKAYLATMTKWYQEGLLNADFYNYDDNPMSTVTEGKKVNGDIGIFSAPASNLKAYCSDAVTYSGVPVFTDDLGENHFISKTVLDTGKGMTVTTKCENVELAVRWCDFWYSEEGQLLSNYGIEGVTFEYDENGSPQWTDLLLNNSNGLSVGIARQCYVTLTQQPGVCPKDIEVSLLDDNAAAAVEAWGERGDGDYVMPTGISLTAEESSRASQIYSDINTLNQETWNKILMGQQSIDTWDDYLTSVRGLGIDEYIGIYQAALDRYNAR